MLSEAEIQKIASLSNLSLTPEEVQKFQKELSGILSFFEQISEINTDGVIPTAQVTGLLDMTRADIPSEDSKADAILSCSKHPIREHQVTVPAIL
ncbi:MAG: Asp-tRNA(Asn)/Glu-tRNA(Gln) amidotransferase subunit GatC [Candidatus Peregrinibacteria bacterium]